MRRRQTDWKQYEGNNKIILLKQYRIIKSQNIIRKKNF
jgi:hypothetical protein